MKILKFIFGDEEPQKRKGISSSPKKNFNKELEKQKIKASSKKGGLRPSKTHGSPQNNMLHKSATQPKANEPKKTLNEDDFWKKFREVTEQSHSPANPPAGNNAPSSSVSANSAFMPPSTKINSPSVEDTSFFTPQKDEITIEINPVINKILEENINKIEAIGTELENVTILERPSDKIIATYGKDKERGMELAHIFYGVLKTIPHHYGITPQHFAIFHIGKYRLGLIFNDKYLISVLMDTEKVNQGMALSIVRPRILQLLMQISQL